LKLDSRNAECAAEKCELFADFFSSVYSDANIPIPDFDFGWNFTVSQCHISPSDVQQRLEALDTRKSAGPDDIPPVILKFCASVLAPHLAIFFSALLAHSIFPSRLKRGYVIPVFVASGDPNNVKNYRPIVIQSTIAKVYEIIILDHLYFHFRKCIHPEQHGFLCGRSTISNLLEFQDYIMKAFSDSDQVDCVYLDFSKAFDRIIRRLLIAKLKAYGVSGSLLKWLNSYLKGRTLIVKFDGSFSRPVLVLSGVPQGSHLGPLCLFMNDIGSIILCSFLEYADDIKLFNRIRVQRDYEVLQETLINIFNWCHANVMDLNETKCVVLSFKRGFDITEHDYVIHNTVLKRVASARDLGVIMTPSLSPFEHITMRANSLLGFILRSTKVFNSPYTLVILFKSLVRPILEYGSVIWSPFQRNHRELLESVQRRFIRMLGIRLGFTYRTTPVDDVGSLFDLPPLEVRREHTDLLTLFRLVNGILDCPSLLDQIDFTVCRGTRSRSIFRRQFHNTYYSYHSGLSRLLRTGSNVPTHIDFFNESLYSFKRKLKLM